MAEITAIAWCDHTFNPWIGCTKVSPGCENCYAEALDKRHRWRGGAHWGPGVARMRTSDSNWREPLKWDRKAAAAGERRLVFCASLADVFDNEIPAAWRMGLWDLIESTPHLTWLLLTKRIGNAISMLRTTDWAASTRWNVWLGASVVNQEEADRDIPKLLAIRARKRFVSYEPALGPVDFARAIPGTSRSPLRGGNSDGLHALTDYPDLPCLDWIIVGGESAQGGAKARPFDIAWARSTVKQCRAAGVSCFVKQLGSNVRTLNTDCFDGDCGRHAWPEGTDDKVESDEYAYQGEPVRVRLKDRAGADPAEWPEDLRVREFPA